MSLEQLTSKHMFGLLQDLQLQCSIISTAQVRCVQLLW